MDETYGPLGILGGGQLGRMLILAAHRLGVKTIFIDPLGPDSPAGQVTRAAVTGSFRDADALEQLAARCKVITYEIEHINVDALDKIAAANPALRIEPPPSTLRIIQDKYAQKVHLTAVGGVPMGEFRQVEDEEAVLRCGADWGFPLMLKAKRGAYDGRGNAVVKDRAAARAALESLGAGSAGNAEIYAERWIPFERELACVVARSSDGGLAAYPVVHTVQKESMCHTTVTPANSNLPHGVDWPAVEAEAARVAQAVVSALPGCGVFGVELFMTAEGRVLFNEVAPRVHNSGHYTQDACACDQFENHVRAVLGMPLGSTQLVVPASAMLNLVGGSNELAGGSMGNCTGPMLRALSIPRTSIHWYGKAEAKPQRKMGHINVTGDSVAEVLRIVRALEGDAEAAAAPPAPVVGVIMGSDSDLPCMKAAAEVGAAAPAAAALRLRRPRPRLRARARMSTRARRSSERPCMRRLARPTRSRTHPRRSAARALPRARNAHVAPFLSEKILKHFKIPFEVTIVSAHRTPDRLVSYSKEAHARGLKVIIAGAGGAAHLPGMVAAMTPLPVIGVPVKTSALSGARAPRHA
jgi:phosphoribosylaminoimidazole carboxylase